MTKTTIYERRFAATNRCKENKWTIRQHKVEGGINEMGFQALDSIGTIYFH